MFSSLLLKKIKINERKRKKNIWNTNITFLCFWFCYRVWNSSVLLLFFIIIILHEQLAPKRRKVRRKCDFDFLLRPSFSPPSPFFSFLFFFSKRCVPRCGKRYNNPNEKCYDNSSLWKEMLFCSLLFYLLIY